MYTDTQPPAVQETQSIRQKTLSIQQDKDSSNVGYRLFVQYHDKLISMPSLVNLTSYFVDANVISSSDGEAFTSAATTIDLTAALRNLLSKILTFCHSDNNAFYKVLRIMQIHGYHAIKLLATEMLEKFLELFLSASTDTGTYKYTVRLFGYLANYIMLFIHLGNEEFLISDTELLSKMFDHNGGDLIIKDHDVTITVPKLAVSEGDKVEVKAAASLIGPYKLPEEYDQISVFVWIGANYMFRKPVQIRIPHIASFVDLNDVFDVVILTANKNDLVLNENNNLVLQMHESVYDYQYEVNKDYCDYYTDHFCSKCLARRRSFISKLFSRLTSSTPRELSNPNRTRTTVFFCVPEDYATADELLIELCICYSLKHCLKVCNAVLIKITINQLCRYVYV